MLNLIQNLSYYMMVEVQECILQIKCLCPRFRSNLTVINMGPFSVCGLIVKYNPCFLRAGVMEEGENIEQGMFISWKACEYIYIRMEI
jgi:hypothetical protein